MMNYKINRVVLFILLNITTSIIELQAISATGKQVIKHILAQTEREPRGDILSKAKKYLLELQTNKLKNKINCDIKGVKLAIKILEAPEIELNDDNIKLVYVLLKKAIIE